MDSVVSAFSPARGLARMQARATLEQMAAITNGGAGYDAGKYNRLTKNWSRQQVNENQIPAGQINQLRAESWNLYRNNPYAKKIVRTLETKVVGRGLNPQSLAKKPDGTPWLEFRDRVSQLWRQMACRLDIRGTPGRGGLEMCDLQKLALRSTILSGDVLCRPVAVKSARAPVPIQLQMIAGERLTSEAEKSMPSGNLFYRGVELNANGQRVAYHIARPTLDQSYTAYRVESDRVEAKEIIHLYVSEDVDQLRGVPWFAPTLLQFRDTGDLQYNTLKASAVAACVVMGYRLATGQSKLGLEGNGNGDLIDQDGNRITKMQPGMMINLGQDGELKGFSPNQPTMNAEAFIKHMLRGVGSALPGVKPSTVTGDYKGATFSSERAADNDCWPEMESVQDWFTSSFCQPIFDELVIAAVVSGYFSDLITPEQFSARRDELLEAAWQGPVARSINPKDDIESAALRVKLGVSSPQIESAAMGRDWQQILRDIKDYTDTATELGVEESYISGVLGVVPEPEPAEAAADEEKPADKAKEDDE